MGNSFESTTQVKRLYQVSSTHFLTQEKIRQNVQME